eukprot:3877160-Prymnesium_polylepis.1
MSNRSDHTSAGCARSGAHLSKSLCGGGLPPSSHLMASTSAWRYWRRGLRVWWPAARCRKGGV